MNPLVFAARRPFTTLLLVAGLAAGGIFALKQKGIDVLPWLDRARFQAALDYVGMGHKSEGESEAGEGKEGGHGEHQKIVVSSPEAKDVVLTQDYVCQIRSQRHIDVCALDNGYLEEIAVKEGQAVKKGDLLFRIRSVLYKARLDAELAEARVAQLEFSYTKKLAEGNLPAVSKNEVALLEAKLAKANAKADLAKAEMEFTKVTAPFDGIVDRLLEREGSLIKEGDVLTSLSDNSIMWVYFNVREAQYLDYMAESEQTKKDDRIELQLANGKKFSEVGKIGAVTANFNNETGNIPFRADFPNPNRLLRHGQTGTILISRTLKNAIVIPQRATFELLDKQYVFVVGDDHVVHQRLITIQHEQEDTFVIKSGLDVKDKIVLEGVREVRDGDKVDYEYRKPQDVLENQKYHAE